MKISKVNNEIIKRILITMLMMTAVIFILELYVPIKRMILGESLTFTDILASLTFKLYFPYIVLAGFIVGFVGYKKNRHDID